MKKNARALHKGQLSRAALELSNDNLTTFRNSLLHSYYCALIFLGQGMLRTSRRLAHCLQSHCLAASRAGLCTDSIARPAAEQTRSVPAFLGVPL